MDFPSLSEIKERKLVQWGLAYLAGAWVVLQVVVTLGGVYGWPGWLLRAVPVILVVGFFGVLALAWYHGERGRQHVSRAEIGILAALLGLAGLGVALIGPGTGDAGTESGEVLASPASDLDQTTIAVLPFEAVQADEEYFADGLAEELLNTLARVPSLRVAARTSAFSFKGSDASADSIGRALGVAHLVEGTVRQSGDRIRVSARLVDAESGLQEWAETYDRELAEVFEIQEDIARSVAFQLKARVGASPKRGTEDPEAYALALRGRQLFEQGGDTRVLGPELVRLFEAALALDSTYAYAWAGLANGRRLVASSSDDRDAEMARAREAAERALALDPDEGWAHFALGKMLAVGYEGRRHHFEQAIAANPSDARSMGNLAYMLMFLGEQEEAVRVAGRGVAIDPLSADALGYGSYAYAIAGRLDQAIEWARESVALDPLYPLWLFNLANVLAIDGQTDEAIDVAERAREMYPSSDLLGNVAAYAYARAGRRNDAERVIEDGGLSDYTRAAVETALGRPDAAFAALDRSIESGSSELGELSFDPWFTPLHPDPRWPGVVERARRIDAE